MQGFTTRLDITCRLRQWRDRAGWIWRWDGEVKKWAGYDAEGRFQLLVAEDDLNDYCDGRGYRPFIEAD